MPACKPMLTVEQFLALPEAEQVGCELLDGEVVRMADSSAHIPALSLDGCDWLAAIKEDGAPAAIPEIAVEIVVSQYAVHIAGLVETYLNGGAKAVWVVYPERKLFDVHYPGGRSRRLHAEDTLAEPDLLDGFALPLTSLFNF